MATTFRILLNTISSHLDEREVHNLVHICDIPEALRARINDGTSLFDNLIKRDIISEHKLDHLKTMLKNLNPKRRDLVVQIEKFESGTHSQSDSISRFSTTSVMSSKSYADDIPSSTEAVCCTLECPCMNVACKKFSFKIAWSYVVLTTFFTICLLTIVLFWYADVPKIAESIASHEHLKEAGPFILTAIFVVYILCLFSMCYVRKRRNRRSYQTAERHNEMKESRAKRLPKNSKNSTGLSRANSRTSSTNYGFSRYMDDENACMVNPEANHDTESPPK